MSQVTRWLAAAVVGVLASAALAAPAHADAPVLTGIVTARSSGAPIVGACVTVFDPSGAQVASGCTDETGRYALSGFGDNNPYKAKASADGFADLWAFNQLSADRANGLWLWTGSTTTVNFGLITGVAAVGGRITDFSGVPVANVQVSAQAETSYDPYTGPRAFTDADGRYFIPGLFPGRYRIAYFTQSFGLMYAYGSETRDGGTLFDLAANTTATVDDHFLAPGAIEVTVVDDITGGPVSRGCVEAGFASALCTGVNGVYTIADLPSGFFTVRVTPDGTHWPTTLDRVEVKRGQTTKVTARVRPAASIITSVRDRATGTPLKDVCVWAIDPDWHGVARAEYSFCSAADGRLAIGPTEPNTRQLLAVPADGVHGAQWVAAWGGVGEQLLARKITTTVGQPVELPAIQLDKAGSIGGTVTDKSTGLPASGVCAYPYAHNPAHGDSYGAANCSDAAGHYTIANLGPYAWPVEFTSSFAYAWQWSGGGDNRFNAARVPVRAGTTATVDAAMVPGGQLTGQVRDTAGAPQFAHVYAYNALTGDFAGPAADTGIGDSYYTIANLNTQSVKVRYVVSGSSTTCWFEATTDPRKARPIRIQAGTTVTTDLTGCG